MSVVFLARPVGRQGMFKMGVHMLVAGGVAVASALACIWITIGILGSYHNSAAKARLVAWEVNLGSLALKWVTPSSCPLLTGWAKCEQTSYVAP